MEYVYHLASPLGGITLASDGEALTGLWFDGQKHFAATLDPVHTAEMLPVFAQTGRWLQLCFEGRIPDFTPVLRPKGTPFQQAVWALLREIPWGETVTYGTLSEALAARRAAGKTSARAVGAAVGRNPISLLIPCHRVVGADGSLTGYAGGLDRKRALLALERRMTGGEAQSAI